ncbi:Oidioi.mRNA.OKI2018_I69.PAR.g11880.t1.cds [Oikopleura dioica]|uniref:Oidioi.mRNA.OKI2018_I69.PAR.g11880.t1.cds n=1 Tax=Oikopleura dioica TaxID=34765 RepID=A0ABN7S0U4_OIKDI|nr:Oidioi.mRNA.OKI2018_I69.PAR.g11880.t1.cds [Oikopleura dioica]
MNLSVAVLPPALRFSPSESKQILTLFNANDEPVKYKMLCTSKDGFQISPSKGEIEPNKRIDIAVRARKLTLSSEEKLRVEFYSMTDKSRRNAKNVNLILDDDKPPEPRPVPRVSETPAVQVKTDQNHFYYMFFVSICIAVLSQSNYLPEFTEAQRLIAAYVLGMMTILLIRSA